MFRQGVAKFRCRKRQSSAAERARRGFRTLTLHVERLEDRCLLTMVAWSGGANGAWDVATNWNPNGVPTSAADVSISTSSPAAITIHSGDVESINSLTLGSNDALLITGGSLATAAGLANSGSITVSAATSLTVGGSFSQSAGATLSLPGGGSGTAPTTNLASNSDFESPTTTGSTTRANGWSYWGTSYLSTQYAYTGSQSMMISGSNSGVVEEFSVTSGASYTVSTYAMFPAASPLTGNENAQLQLLFYDSQGDLISPYQPPNSLTVLSSSSAAGGPLAGSVGNQGWNHFYTTAVAPANATSVAVQVTTQDDGSGAVYWDDLEFGPSPAGPSALVAGSISNSGTITVGPTNTITSNTTFTQTSTGTLDTQLGGAPASGAFGFVTVAGSAALAGTLKADIVYGYSPLTTDSFMPIEFASESGTFATYAMPSGPTYQFAGAVTFTNVVVSAAPTAALTTTVNVVDSHPVATNLLGVNLTNWDQDLPTSETQQMVTAAGLNIYRFPGGSDSDDYHFNSASNGGAADNFVQFVQFIVAVNGTGMVTLDYGSGSPQEAAAELAYLEGSTTDTTTIGTGIEWNDSSGQWQSVNWGTVGYWASLRAASPLATDDGLNFMRIDHPAPITNVKYWEVGNEVYGSSWETDHHGTLAPGGVSTGAAHDPHTYATFAAQFATYATEIVGKAGLPVISIGIDSGDPTGESDNNWTRNVLTDGANMQFVPGFISDHSYMQAPGSESDSFLLGDTVSDAGSLLDWTTRYNDYESLLEAIVPSQAASVSIMATEFNSVYTNPGKQSTSLVNGLFIANSLGSLLDSGYDGAVVWDLRNNWLTGNNNSNLLYGWREGGDYGILGEAGATNGAPDTGAYIAYPSYYALQLASKIAVNGGEVISAASNYSELDAYAVMESSGDLELLVINTNPAAGLTEQFNLTGFQPSGSAQVWQYGETQDTAQSQSGTGASALTSFGATLALSGANFSFTFPAYSMTVIDLAPLHAPTISGSGTLSTVIVGNNPNPGTLVSALLASGVTITGAGATPGIAVDNVNNGDGTWQFSTNDGANWSAFGLPSDTAARLLLADANTRIRFVPSAGFTGMVTAGLTFRAWNPATGTNGGTADASSNGGSTYFSSATVSASILVDAAPIVVGAYVSGSAWAASYLSVLDDAGLGDPAVAGQGFQLAGGANQLTTMLPWTNVTQISIAFSEPVALSQDSLTLYNSTNTAISSSGYSYNSTTFIATWQFASPLAANKYVMNLAASLVSDSAGTQLDGEWTTSVSTFASGSGDGTPGGDFNFYFNVLPGDANNSGSVTNGDVLATKLQVGAASNSSNYQLDVNASGNITNSDVLLEKLQVGSNINSFSSPQLPAIVAPAVSPANAAPLVVAPALSSNVVVILPAAATAVVSILPTSIPVSSVQVAPAQVAQGALSFVVSPTAIPPALSLSVVPRVASRMIPSDALAHVLDSINLASPRSVFVPVADVADDAAPTSPAVNTAGAARAPGPLAVDRFFLRSSGARAEVFTALNFDAMDYALRPRWRTR